MTSRYKPIEGTIQTSDLDASSEGWGGAINVAGGLTDQGGYKKGKFVARGGAHRFCGGKSETGLLDELK